MSDQKKPPLSQRIRSRLPGGELFMGAVYSARAWMRWGTVPARSLLRAYLIRIFMGYGATMRRGIHLRGFRLVERLETPGPMYHLIYDDLLPAVRREGLKSEAGYIFLTDSLQIAERYYAWKDDSRGRPGEHMVLVVDAARLRDGDASAVFRTDVPHEYLTGPVPPGCILAVAPYVSESPF